MIKILENKYIWIAPLSIFMVLSLKNLIYPGLYMDSVNPDYIASWLIRGEKTIPAWIYPDNYLLGTYNYPLLNSLYGGNTVAYIGSIFFSMFGFGIINIRVFHILIGFVLILAMIWMLKKFKINKVAILISVLIMSVDPTFVYIWRTQFYLQMFPLIFFFLGLGLIGEYIGEKRKKSKLLLSGILFGFASYNYFIFFIYTITIFTIIYFNRDINKKDIYRFLTGVILGWAPFLYAHLSILLNEGLLGYIQKIQSLQYAYGVIDTNQGSIFSKVEILYQRLELLIFGNGLNLAIFGLKPSEYSLLSLFVVILILATMCLLLVCEFFQKNNNKYIFFSSIILGILFIHFIFGLMMGRPLGTQHYVMLLPLFYIVLAIILNNLFEKINKLPLRLTLTFFCIPIFIANLHSTVALDRKLTFNGASGYYSNNINTTIEYLDTLPSNTLLLFPQWGYWMGALTALGPKFNIIEANSISDLSAKLKSTIDINKFDKIALIYSKNNKTDSELIGFLNQMNLSIKNAKVFEGNNSKDDITVINIEKSKNY